jgi:hypothetical protein
LQGGITNANWQILTVGISGAPAGTFLSLTDAPSSYVGHSNDLVQVKSDETGLNFHKFAKGSVTCDLVNQLYTVTDSKIASGDLPNVTILAPAINSTQFTLSVVNVISGSFQIELSGVPSVSGYKLSWLII